MELSVVVPMHNEAENAAALANEIAAALDGVIDYEIVFVDDGSTDATIDGLREAARRSPRVRVVRHLRQAGQSTAIRTGVARAGAPWVATLDGDGQNDPADLRVLLAARDAPDRPARLELIIGDRRAARRDSWPRRVSSWIANTVRAAVLRDRTPDVGCGVKLFPRDAFLDLPYFDHMHRFLPALFQRRGGVVRSVPVSHRPRRGGRSHYGVHNRLWVGLVDLCGVVWLLRRGHRPHVIADEATEPTPPSVHSRG